MSQYTNMSFKLNNDLKKKVENQAEKEHTSKSTIIRKAVDQYCDGEK